MRNATHQEAVAALIANVSLIKLLVRHDPPPKGLQVRQSIGNRSFRPDVSRFAKQLRAKRPQFIVFFFLPDFCLASLINRPSKNNLTKNPAFSFASRPFFVSTCTVVIY